MPMNGVTTDLRRIVSRASHLAVPWSAADIAEASGQDAAHTQTYLKSLVRQGVLIELPGATFGAGPNAKKWRMTKPKTKPGGNSVGYVRCKNVFGRLAQAEWQAKRAGGLTGQTPTQADNDRQTPTPDEIQKDDEMNAASPVVAADSLNTVSAAVALNCSCRSIERWVKSKKLKVWRLPGGEFRIPISEIARIKGIS